MLRRSTERRTAAQNVITSNRGKKVWSEEEDDALRKLVEIHGTGNWTLIAQSLTERSGKQCRERFHNHLDKGIKKGDWTEEEDRIIIILQRAMGNQWAKITKMLPGRTDNAVKNRFHATERAKSRGKLDDAFLNDPEFAEQIVKEAFRISKDLDSQGSDVETESYTSGYTYSSRSSYNTTIGTPVHVAQVMNSGRYNTTGIALQATAVPMPVLSESMDLENDDFLDEEEEEDCDADGLEEDEEEFSVDELMELDIISLDEDDFDFDEFASPINPSSAAAMAASRANNDGCFSFDWGSGRFNPVDISKAKDLANRASYFCGLDNCLSSGNGNKPPVPTTAMPSDMYYLQQKMSLNNNTTINNAGGGSSMYHHHPAAGQQQYPPLYPGNNNNNNNNLNVNMNQLHLNNNNYYNHQQYNQYQQHQQQPAPSAPVYGHPYSGSHTVPPPPPSSSATSFFCSR